MYDVRFTDTYPACGLNWPPEMHAITHFLGVSVSSIISKSTTELTFIYSEQTSSVLSMQLLTLEHGSNAVGRSTVPSMNSGKNLRPLSSLEFYQRFLL